MSFHDVVQRIDFEGLRRRIAACERAEVERALARPRPDDHDVIALLSPAAEPYLEALAQRSAAVTERRFGKVIQLYTPLYVSNECVNACVYCGFARRNDILRVTLSPEEAVAEAEILHEEGFRHILLVSGECRHRVGLAYLREVARGLHGRFDSISIEVNPLSAQEYRQLVAVGVDGLTLYQETYNPARYAQLHPSGPKRDYVNRLQSIEHGGEAGFRSLGVGALLGLWDWRAEAVLVALHGRYLTRRFWQSRVAVSFPRIRASAGGYQSEYPVTDRDVVQMICALRLALPDAELVMSTREPAALRDHLIGLGITRMSAGSRTSPGGYSDPEAAGRQFDVVDERSPAEVAAVIDAKGFEPVWKDFDREFIAAR